MDLTIDKILRKSEGIMYEKQLLTDYLNNNWFNCDKMWVLFYRNEMENFGTNTNNHIERFMRTLKSYLKPTMHLSECLVTLLKYTNKRLKDDNEIKHLKKRKLVLTNAYSCNFILSAYQTKQ